jgi:hypothetical protein
MLFQSSGAVGLRTCLYAGELDGPYNHSVPVMNCAPFPRTHLPLYLCVSLLRFSQGIVLPNEHCCLSSKWPCASRCTSVLGAVGRLLFTADDFPADLGTSGPIPMPVLIDAGSTTSVTPDPGACGDGCAKLSELPMSVAGGWLQHAGMH